ncbi:CvpA family protein [Aliarcobacter cibarius]|jgi:membrane protein required for colicin V production|uniref:CvpA family protein n=1 Tax=Aliarcobacter cibarius TaxID=255507 RepID=UPI0010FE1248|nr:CvpA family protein [Aliarcobacter cibarius]QEZ89552.1 CvpA family membrane protein [Aliarcobacter cibarius]TLT04443.1 CvpA family protein [Aliarcobacter cibarius]
MQDFSIFDLIIIAITLLLGLKGLFRGFIKEVFGLLGIVGAIFVASRISKELGDLIAPILVLENEATIKLIGFIVALVVVWLVIYSAGVVVSKIFSASGLGAIDRIFGFIFGALKIFLIFAVIAYALYQVQSFKKVIDEKFANSIVMPHLLSVGSFIIKLDTTAITQNLDKAVDSVKPSEVIENTKKNIEENIQETKKDIEENIKEEVTENLEEKFKDVTKELSNKQEDKKEN